MIPDRLKALDFSLQNSHQLLNKLISASYPFAMWRLPQTSVSYLLIGLQPEEPMNSIYELENLTECFIVNPFHESHPPKPLVLKGDLLIRMEDNRSEVKLSPMISAELLEKFHSDMNRSDSAKLKNEEEVSTSPIDYVKMVEQARKEISAGLLEKVVLARSQEVRLPNTFDVGIVFDQLSNRYPNAFPYVLNTQKHGLWIGATPEKLIAVENSRYFSTDSLAGTQPLNGQSLSDVAWTMKEIEEQAMVSRYIINCFKKIRLREYEEIGPKTVKAGNMAHLKTSFQVDMQETNSPQLASTMVELLHPTSAVCGFPRDKALAFIDSHEGFDRELYAGFLGPVNVAGSTNLFVNLRCMKVLGTTARLFAGAGITDGSNPAKELAETELKMNTLLAVLK